MAVDSEEHYVASFSRHSKRLQAFKDLLPIVETRGQAMDCQKGVGNKDKRRPASCLLVVA